MRTYKLLVLSIFFFVFSAQQTFAGYSIIGSGKPANSSPAKETLLLSDILTSLYGSDFDPTKLVYAGDKKDGPDNSFTWGSDNELTFFGVKKGNDDPNMWFFELDPPTDTISYEASDLHTMIDLYMDEKGLGDIKPFEDNYFSHFIAWKYEGTTPENPAVPEPASFILFCMGLLGIARVRREVG